MGKCQNRDVPHLVVLVTRILLLRLCIIGSCDLGSACFNPIYSASFRSVLQDPRLQGLHSSLLAYRCFRGIGRVDPYNSPYII